MTLSNLKEKLIEADQRSAQNKPWLFPCLALFVFWLIFWHPVIFGFKQLFVRDLTFYAYPMKHYMMERFFSGEFPFWTPRESTGLPFFAEPSHQVLYPLNLIFFLLPRSLVGNEVMGLSWFVVLHCLFALWTMWIFGRVLGLSRWFSVVFAILYGLSGYSISITDNVNYLPAVAWVPLIFAMVYKGLSQTRLIQALPYASVTAVCILLLLLAGDGFNATFLSGFLGLLLALRWGVNRFSKSGASKSGDLFLPGLNTLSSCIFLGLCIGLGVGMALIQILPTQELLALSVRQEPLTYEEITLWSFPQERFIELILPYFYGSKLPQPHFIGQYFYPAFHEPWADSVYIGIIPILLALISLKYRWQQSLFWALLITVGFLLALGMNVPYYRMLVDLVPPLQVYRYLEKFVFWSNLGICVMAGLGWPMLTKAWEDLTHWLNEKGRFFHLGLQVGTILLSSILFVHIPAQLWIWTHNMERETSWGTHFYERAPHVLGLYWHWILLAILVSSVIWFKSPQKSKLYFKGLVIFAILDLFLMHYDHMGSMPTELLVNRPTPVAEKALRETFKNKYPIRVYYDDKAEVKETDDNPSVLERIAKAYGQEYIGDNYWYYWPYLVLYNQDRLLFNYGIAYGINYQNGRFAPLQPKTHKRLDVVLTEKNPDWLNILHSVDVIITPIYPANPDWEKSGYTEIFKDPNYNLKLLKVDNTLPRAYIAPNPIFNPDPINVYKMLVPPFANHPASQHVELASDTPTDFKTPEKPVSIQATQVSVLDDRPEKITVQLNSPYDHGTLVVTESWFPGWKAYLEAENGLRQEIPLLMANHRFLGVPLMKGSHRITLEYTSTQFKNGLMLTLLFAIATLGLGILPRYQKLFFK